MRQARIFVARGLHDWKIGRTRLMSDKAHSSGSYRIEVSGWGLDECYFVEKTDLLWTEGNEKRLLLRHAVPDRAMVFIRLLVDGTPGDSVPVPYQVENLQPMNRIGLCEMRLLPLHPRAKTPEVDETAPQIAEVPTRGDDAGQDSPMAELEEVLHEA
jgi:hypothetical protein